jgi:magnesium chelatase family protein
MIGPPGVGKSLLASVSTSLLPPLTPASYAEVIKIHTLGSQTPPPLLTSPFRAPHHTITPARLLGSPNGHPGEFSYAHHGVLFLDELGEFKRSTLEALRQPMEERAVHVAGTTILSDFTILAAANPCPCGYYGDSSHDCRCSDYQRRQYQAKFSAPFLDRFDIIIVVNRSSLEYNNDSVLMNDLQHTTVVKTLNNYFQHAENDKIRCEYITKNTSYTSLLQPQAHALLTTFARTHALSKRAVLSLQRIAAVIAQLDSEKRISTHHMAEAIQLRSNPWGDTQ